MKHFFVIAGGKIEDGFVCGMLQKEKPDQIIAADAGINFLYRNKISPNVIVGDFDSADSEALRYFKTQKEIELHELNPMKDDTDTESAVRLAISKGAEKITILGGTGSRLDHVLGNIELLGIGLLAGIPMVLMDSCNRVRMVREGFAMKKSEQFGTYVSLLPYTGQVEHVTLRGFKYPLSDYCLKGFCSIGISNEIVDEEAFIEFDGGILLVVESVDGSL